MHCECCVYRGFGATATRTTHKSAHMESVTLSSHRVRGKCSIFVVTGSALQRNPYQDPAQIRETELVAAVEA